ncbi:phosphotransferase, partial [Streptomyces sp. NRRL S-15]|uniref:phosphotransferase n=1 Tax=Streptomyces sp. NRRL S-15 TaxID=1463886 RepID=UPI0004CA2318
MDEMRAREVLTAAGLPDGAELLALGENAVFGVGDLVVKVGRDATHHPELRKRAEREVAVARWLADSGVPAVRAAESPARLVEGHPVTLWHRLPGAVRPSEPRDLAPLLTQIHALPAPDHFTLPRRELLGGVERLSL